MSRIEAQALQYTHIKEEPQHTNALFFTAHLSSPVTGAKMSNRWTFDTGLNYPRTISDTSLRILLENRDLKVTQ